MKYNGINDLIKYRVMSIDSKEVERITKLQVGKKCNSCKTGKYVNFGMILCDNCGKEPFKNY